MFIGYLPGNKTLYAYLKASGYKLIFKPILEIKKKHSVKVKGNVDAELVLHTMIELPNYDKAIIVTGDGDFHCLVEYLLKKRKLHKLLIPNKKKYSRLFLPFKKYMDYMNNQREKLGKK